MFGKLHGKWRRGWVKGAGRTFTWIHCSASQKPPGHAILSQYKLVDLTGSGTFLPSTQRSPQQDILHNEYLISEDIITGSIPKGYGFPEYTPGTAGSSCKYGFVSITCVLQREKGKIKQNQWSTRGRKNTIVPSVIHLQANQSLTVGATHQLVHSIIPQMGTEYLLCAEYHPRYWATEITIWPPRRPQSEFPKGSQPDWV